MTLPGAPEERSELLNLPPDLLRRVLCAACDTPAQLLRCGAVSGGMRRAVGAPLREADALTALWQRVMAFADPAAGLLPPGALTQSHGPAAGMHPGMHPGMMGRADRMRCSHHTA